MGIDLKLLPCPVFSRGWRPRSLCFSHQLLTLTRYSELWEYIEALPTMAMTDEWRTQFNAYVSRVPDGSLEGEPCYGLVVETPYGDPLEWVRADQLADTIQAFNEKIGDVSHVNVAAGAYLAALDPDTPVALYWS